MTHTIIVLWVCYHDYLSNYLAIGNVNRLVYPTVDFVYFALGHLLFNDFLFSVHGHHHHHNYYVFFAQSSTIIN